MEQYFIVVYNEALHVFFSPEPAGSTEDGAKERARLKEVALSQIGRHKVHLVKEVSFKR